MRSHGPQSSNLVANQATQLVASTDLLCITVLASGLAFWLGCLGSPWIGFFPIFEPVVVATFWYFYTKLWVSYGDPLTKIKLEKILTRCKASPSKRSKAYFGDLNQKRIVKGVKRTTL